MKKRVGVVAAIAFAAFAAGAIAEGRANYVPKEGYVPDAATAVRIAEAVWIPIYGAENIASERPFKATLRGGVWFVEGSMPKVPGYVMKGGVAEAEIAKSDGRILRVIHGK